MVPFLGPPCIHYRQPVGATIARTVAATIAPCKRLISFASISTLRDVPAFQKRQVLVHVTFAKLGEISTTQEQFTAKVLITARWREASLDKAPSGNDQLPVVSRF